jgi:transketolase
MADLQFVPQSEFRRLEGLHLRPVPRTSLFAGFCRINALYMVARARSGHLGSSFSSLDVVSWLYLNELRKEDGNGSGDLYFSSKGHDAPGLYAVLLATGVLPYDRIHDLRRLGGLPGHPDIATTGIVTNTGPLGMGISKAKGMIEANRLRGRSGRVFVMTGDGELQEGQIWESLATAAHRGMGELTVLVDHNKIQSDTHVASVSDLGDLERKFASFGWSTARCDGHDLTALSRVLKRLARTTGRPKVVVCDTVKGRGVSFMEHTAMTTADRFYRFHSGAPDDDTYSRALAELVSAANTGLEAAGANPLRLETRSAPGVPLASGVQRMIPAYSRALLRQAERHRNLVALDADLILDTGLIPFQERFPDRFVECGIAEQDMVSQAGGMALSGLLPVVHSFACFLSTRPNEQIYNNATERTKVIYVGSLAGLLPGGPGHSHQSVRDIAALSGTPELVMLEPSCEEEVALALDWCVERAASSCYLRLVSIPCSIPYQLSRDYRLEPGRGVVLREGADVVLFGYGPVLLPEAWRAAEILARDHGIGIRIVNLPWLNQVDDEWLRDTVRGYTRIITIDNHYVAGGQGQMIAARLAQLGLIAGVEPKTLGVTEIPASGQNDEVLRFHGLDAAGIASTIIAGAPASAGTGSA